MSKIIIAIPRGRIIKELKTILMKTTFAPEVEMFDDKSRKLTFLSNLMPKTVVARMTSVLFIGILVAQVLGTWLWVEQLKSSEKERMAEISQELGYNIAQAVGFFEKLPNQYRQVTLVQLRQNGGTFLYFGS